MSEDAVEPAVAALYEAAADAARWPRALAAVAVSVGADLVRLLIWDDRRNEVVLSAIHGADPRDEAPCVAHHGASDPRRQPIGRTVARHDPFDEAFVRSDPFDGAFFVPAGFRYVAGIRLTAGHGRTTVLGIHRTKRRGPFAADDRARIEALTPHVRWAAEMHRRLAPEADTPSLALRALDGINAPLAIVDADARVLLANRAALSLLGAGDGLSLRGERLTIAEPAAAAALRRLLRAAFAAATAGLALEDGGQIVVPRPSGRRAYALLATPLPEATDLAAGRPAVLLHLVDPESRRRPASVNLRRLYGLTTAEADLAAGLLNGLRLEDFAEERGVRLTTVRTQLRGLFEKTDTNRQPELIRLLTRLTLLRDATEERPRHRIGVRRAGTDADDWRAGLPVAALPAGAPSGAGRLGAAGGAP